MKKCIHCGEMRYTRPYGPNGSDVCAPCAMETPERKTEAERQLNARWDQAAAESTTGVIVLTPEGPKGL